MKHVGDSASKPRRLMSMMGSSGIAVAVRQLPSQLAGSLTVDGLKPANAITLDDSSDESNGGANISKVINNEIVSISY